MSQPIPEGLPSLRDYENPCTWSCPACGFGKTWFRIELVDEASDLGSARCKVQFCTEIWAEVDGPSGKRWVRESNFSGSPRLRPGERETGEAFFRNTLICTCAQCGFVSKHRTAEDQEKA